MGQLNISLFGRMRVRYDGQIVEGYESVKVQELFCYLLLNRDRPHSREVLASLIWGNHCTTAQSKKYLRKALWQLQTALNAIPDSIGSGLLAVESDWIRLNSIDALSLDVAAFESVYARVKGVQGRFLDQKSAESVENIIQLYQGDLLEGWYVDWCLLERERLQHHYLSMLDKLMGYCEAVCRYEAGLTYGERILQYDRARERTHQRMMRLYYLAQDRTEALRQFERCVTALKEELNVKPAKSTIALYEQIKADQLDDIPVSADSEIDISASGLNRILGNLRQLRSNLATLEQQLESVMGASGSKGV